MNNIKKISLALFFFVAWFSLAGICLGQASIEVTPKGNRVVQDGAIDNLTEKKDTISPDITFTKLNVTVTFVLKPPKNGGSFSPFTTKEKQNSKYERYSYIDFAMPPNLLSSVTETMENGQLKIVMIIAKDKYGQLPAEFEGNLSGQGEGEGEDGSHWSVALVENPGIVVFFGGGFYIPEINIDTGPIFIPLGWGGPTAWRDAVRKFLKGTKYEGLLNALENAFSASYEIETVMKGKTLVVGGLKKDLTAAEQWLKGLALKPEDKTPIRIVGYSTGTACALALARKITENPKLYGFPDEDSLKMLLFYDFDWGAASMPIYSDFLYDKGVANAFRRPLGNFVYQHVISNGLIDKAFTISIPYLPSPVKMKDPIPISQWTIELWDLILFRNPTILEYVKYNVKLANTSGVATWYYTSKPVNRKGAWLKPTDSYASYTWSAFDKSLFGNLYPVVVAIAGDKINIDHFALAWFTNLTKFDVMWRLYPLYMKQKDPTESTNPSKNYTRLTNP
ncbi:MAG: hypothetical protein HZA50_02600 [Planctomycetes bacterium]|nr:hypothetical protein [Planctomycetota bacterium]